MRLINEHPQPYGDKFQDHLLEQYKLCIEMADRTSQRRISMHAFYLSILSSIIALYGGALSLKIINFSAGVLIAMGVAGGIMALNWWQMIRAYRQLNDKKYQTINELEKMLPAQPYAYEWYLATHGEGKDKHKRMTQVESMIPLLFIVIFAIGIVTGFIMLIF